MGNFFSSSNQAQDTPCPGTRSSYYHEYYAPPDSVLASSANQNTITITTTTGGNTVRAVTYTERPRNETVPTLELAPAPVSSFNVNQRADGAIHRRHQPNRNRQERVREPKEDYEFRKTILRQFKCPFEEEQVCFYLNSGHSERCFFSHESENYSDVELKTIPPYVCIYELTNRCHTTNYSRNEAAPDTNWRRQGLACHANSDGDNRPCPNGLHLKLEEMVDTNSYERRHKAQIKRFYGPNVDLECGVCLEKVLLKRLSSCRRFGILESCEHVFCANCLKNWRAQGTNRETSCPVCRTVSRRIAFRRRFVSNKEDKQRMFGAMH